MHNCVALIVAAGRGTRFGGAVLKQYARIGGASLLRHAIVRTLASDQVKAVRTVIAAGDEPLYAEAVSGLDVMPAVGGGATRRESVLRGLESLAQDAPEFVAIQDAARPMVTRQMLSEAILAAGRHGGAIAAVPVVDTLKRADDTLVGETVPRGGLWQAQTPQVFRFDAILAAHRAAARMPQDTRDALTDDAQVAELAGIPVALVPGSPDNFKVTTEADLERLGRLLASERTTEMRVGTGFDVHAFGAGEHVMLCGVRIPHDRGLVGHSDADVALHAVTDALLGAVGAGDIGQHFPPGEAQWRGVSSDRFVRHAAGLVRAQGGRVVNVDVTLICERPKIGPYRAAMVDSLASILEVSPRRVSVKATTTEKLGFTGRGEGIAAQASASVEMPGGAET